MIGRETKAAQLLTDSRVPNPVASSYSAGIFGELRVHSVEQTFCGCFSKLLSQYNMLWNPYGDEHPTGLASLTGIFQYIDKSKCCDDQMSIEMNKLKN